MITPRQLEILQHALGLNKYGRCAAHEDPRGCRDHSSDTLPGHRNRFCAGGECVSSTEAVPLCGDRCDVCVCRSLVALGLMVQHKTTSWLPYFNCSVTDEGRAAVREQSPPAPKLSRSQQRYRAFLNADSGLKFGEWLKWESRRSSMEGM